MGTRRNYQRTSNKNDSPLHVLPVAEKLIDYTLDLTDNAKRFPKRVRFSITNKIQGHVMAIYDDLLEANEIFPIRTEADRTERLRLQRTALTECKKLLHMIELSKKRSYIDKDTFDYWTKLTLDVKFMTAIWCKAVQDTAVAIAPSDPITGKRVMLFRVCPVTPNASDANYARSVSTDGSLNNNNAYNGNNGVRPDLVENATE